MNKQTTTIIWNKRGLKVYYLMITIFSISPEAIITVLSDKSDFRRLSQEEEVS